MTDDLMKLAQQSGAGVVYDGSVSAFSKEELAEFARLIRAAERERCAKVCEATSPRHTECQNKIAAAIRALEDK